MTREEQIKKQADIYTDDASNYTEWSEDNGWSCINDIELVEKAFIEGAKWADSNPNFPWISVDDDLPCKHPQLLEKVNYTQTVLVVLSWNDDPTKKHIETAYMCNKIGSFDVNWYWENRAHYHVTHWMPMPELPTKE